MITRTRFVSRTLPGAIALAAAPEATRQPARVEASDPLATSLGCKHDAAKGQAKNYATCRARPVCADRQLNQAKGSEPWAARAALNGKLVNVKGWSVARVSRR